MKHPGVQIRKECIEKHGLTVTEAARLLHVDRQTLSNLVNERSGVPPRNGHSSGEGFFGTSARSWMRRQLEFEYEQVMRRAAKIKVAPFESSRQGSQGEEGE